MMLEAVTLVALMSQQIPLDTNKISVNQSMVMPSPVVELRHEDKLRDIYRKLTAYRIIAQSA